MSTASVPKAPDGEFTVVQKEFLAGLMAGVAQRNIYPYVGIVPGSGAITATPSEGGENLASPSTKWHGQDVADLCKQELWKMQEHGLDCWDRLLAH